MPSQFCKLVFITFKLTWENAPEMWRREVSRPDLINLIHLTFPPVTTFQPGVYDVSYHPIVSVRLFSCDSRAFSGLNTKLCHNKASVVFQTISIIHEHFPGENTSWFRSWQKSLVDITAGGGRRETIGKRQKRRREEQHDCRKSWILLGVYCIN